MPEGTPILAARAGIVFMTVAENDAGGADEAYRSKANVVRILHADGTIGNYVHLMHAGVAVKNGERVEPGKLIGYAGNTGMSSGPHLHFAVTRVVREGDELAEVSEPFRFYVGKPPRALHAAIRSCGAGGLLVCPGSRRRYCVRRASCQRTSSIRPVEVLDDRGAAVDPVAAVEVGDAVDLACAAAWMWPQITPSAPRLAGVARHRLLELVDEAERGLHLIYFFSFFTGAWHSRRATSSPARRGCGAAMTATC